MTRYKKLHIIPSDKLRQAVLDGVPSVALCGDRRIRTKDDIDAIKDLTLPACRKCSDIVAEMTKQSDVVLRERKGWEQFEKETRPNPAVAFRITVSGSIARWDFPLAG